MPGGAQPEAVVAQLGVTAYPLCAVDGTRVGLEVDADQPVIRTQDDAAHVISRLVGASVGNLVSADVVSLESGGGRRSSRQVFYESGLLHLYVVRDENGSEHIRLFDFFSYREVTDRFSQCVSVAVSPGDKLVRIVHGAEGVLYTLADRLTCDGQTVETLRAAGPTDRSYPRPNAGK